MRPIHFLLLAFLAIRCQTPEARLEKGIDAYLQTQVQKDGPGAAVLVMKDTVAVYAKGIGVANLQTGEAITPETLFNIGSVTKTFVSYGILMLQEEGRLSLDDSLIQYFSGFKNKTIAGKVKIRHLLTHTSGLPDIRPVKEDSVFYLTANDAQNWAPITQTDSLLFEPGTRYQYSNPAFNGLALIIEKVTGRKWQDFIRERIFLPAGMIHSTITDGAHPSTGVSHAYTRIDGQWREDDFMEEPTFCAAGNGGIWSSVRELALYELALRKATFLPLAVIDDSATIQPMGDWKDTIPSQRGWAWVIDKTPDGLKCINHTGSQGGFVAYYLSVPEKRILVVLLSNQPLDVEVFRTQTFGLLQEVAWLDRGTNP